MPNDQETILIVGAGIAGLVLAQGLKHRNIPFKVFERDPDLSSKAQGYRFRCEAPGLEALEETVSPGMWDLIEKTHPKDSPPILTILDPHSGEKKSEMNTIADPDPRAQRCYPIDRAWFRELMYNGIEDNVHFGKSFESYNILESGNVYQCVQVTFTDGTKAVGRLLVAADGVRSHVRRQMLPHLKQVDVERMVMWGRTPLNDSLRAKMPKPAFATHFAMTVDTERPTRMCLWAPIEWPKGLPEISQKKLSTQDDYVFWALPTETNKALLKKDLRVEEKMEWIETVTKKWDDGLKALFREQDPTGPTILPVYTSCPDLDEWQSNGCVTFLGDAIHVSAMAHFFIPLRAKLTVGQCPLGNVANRRCRR